MHEVDRNEISMGRTIGGRTMNDNGRSPLAGALFWLRSGPLIPKSPVPFDVAWGIYETDMHFVGIVRRLGSENELMTAASVACLWQSYWWENHPDMAEREWHCDQWLELAAKMDRVERWS
jgi:hypothetical protein